MWLSFFLHLLEKRIFAKSNNIAKERNQPTNYIVSLNVKLRILWNNRFHWPYGENCDDMSFTFIPLNSRNLQLILSNFKGKWFPLWKAEAQTTYHIYKITLIFKRNSWLVVSAENINKLVLFWKIFNSYIYGSVDQDTITNSGRYLMSGVCNLENIVTKLKRQL